MTKYKGQYTLKCEYDQEKIEFNRKLNGTYEDTDVYVQCANKCKIFYYGNRGTLQFYCPSVPRGKNNNLEFTVFLNSTQILIRVVQLFLFCWYHKTIK